MECEYTNNKMVATLQLRKDALEAKLREKTQELKKLCIQEAELTGILPPETPIESGESPPVFRRKLGTSFAYPDNLIDKLKSKEEVLAKLELECKIQTSISEAALGLANDGNASKSIRRKHRLEYQQSQQRLAELEMRLSVLRQSIKSSSNQFQRKKPRPPLNVETDCIDGIEVGSAKELDNHSKSTRADEPTSLSFVNRDIIRNSHFYNSFGKSSHNYPLHASQTYQPNKKNLNRNQAQRQSIGRIHQTSSCYNDNANWLEDPTQWHNTTPAIGYFSNQCYTTLPTNRNHMKSRYGSLDRRHQASLNAGSNFNSTSCLQSISHASPTPSCYQQSISPSMRHHNMAGIHNTNQNGILSPGDPILLPNQTYPENSLMRTQSLGNVEQHPRKSLDTHSLQEKVLQENFQCSTLGRQTREKEWRETLLDADCYQPNDRIPPLHQRTSKAIPQTPVIAAADTITSAESTIPHQPFPRCSTHLPPPLPPPHNPIPASPPPPPPPLPQAMLHKSPVKSPNLIESSVPYESPKNHTVVEVGKWQPYREVTKPFEMSDFYKYSTKYRKNND